MQIKQWVIQSIGRIFDLWLHRLSEGERRWVLSKLDAEIKFRLGGEERQAKFRHLSLLCKDLGVLSCSANGTLGLFEGSAQDEAVMGNYILNGTYDPSYQRLLCERLFGDNKGAYIDIGANIGLTVIPLAERRSGVKCFAFEPDPTNFLCLKKNIVAHGVEDRVRPFNYAAYSSEGELTFELSSRNAGDHRVRKEGGAQRGKFDENSRVVIRVQATTVDSVVDAEALLSPVVVKMDTQGSELQVVRGAPKLLSRADYLCSEFAPYWIRRLGDSPDELVNCWSDLGFRFGFIADGSFSTSGSPVTQRIEDLSLELRNFAERSSGDQFTNVFLSRSPL